MTLLAIKKTVSDKEAALFQKEENENRVNLSDYARSLSLKKQLDSNIFESEAELSKFLNISRKTLNDIFAYTRIPTEVLNAIPNVHQISRNTAVKIATLAKNKQYCERLIELGPKIGNKSISANNLQAAVLSEPTGRGRSEVFSIHNDQDRLVAKLKKMPNGNVTININNQFAEN